MPQGVVPRRWNVGSAETLKVHVLLPFAACALAVVTGTSGAVSAAGPPAAARRDQGPHPSHGQAARQSHHQDGHGPHVTRDVERQRSRLLVDRNRRARRGWV